MDSNRAMPSESKEIIFNKQVLEAQVSNLANEDYGAVLTRIFSNATLPDEVMNRIRGIFDNMKNQVSVTGNYGEILNKYIRLVNNLENKNELSFSSDGHFTPWLQQFFPSDPLRERVEELIKEVWRLSCQLILDDQGEIRLAFKKHLIALLETLRKKQNAALTTALIDSHPLPETLINTQNAAPTTALIDKTNKINEEIKKINKIIAYINDLDHEDNASEYFVCGMILNAGEYISTLRGEKDNNIGSLSALIFNILNQQIALYGECVSALVSLKTQIDYLRDNPSYRPYVQDIALIKSYNKARKLLFTHPACDLSDLKNQLKEMIILTSQKLFIFQTLDDIKKMNWGVKWGGGKKIKIDEEIRIVPTGVAKIYDLCNLYATAIKEGDSSYATTHFSHVMEIVKKYASSSRVSRDPQTQKFYNLLRRRIDEIPFPADEQQENIQQRPARR